METETETATMAMASEVISIPEPPNVFIYNENTKGDIPNDVTHVKVDPSVKEIRDKAFRNCHSLVKVEFSEGLKVIGEGAFQFCRNLKHMNKLPSTLKEIHDWAFAVCRRLDSIQFPKRLQVIGEAAFSSCHGLKRIKMSSAQVVIKWGAFAPCYGLISGCK